MEQTSSVTVPAPQYKVVAEMIAMILREGRDGAHDQDTVRTALSSFARAVDATPPPPHPCKY
jgi:hypothetical protein